MSLTVQDIERFFERLQRRPRTSPAFSRTASDRLSTDYSFCFAHSHSSHFTLIPHFAFYTLFFPFAVIHSQLVAYILLFFTFPKSLLSFWKSNPSHFQTSFCCWFLRFSFPLYFSTLLFFEYYLVWILSICFIRTNNTSSLASTRLSIIIWKLRQNDL